MRAYSAETKPRRRHDRLTWSERVAPMKRLRFAIVISTCAALAFAPSLAEARAGNSTSQGSRGSKTYDSSTTAKPVERSATPQPSRQPQYVPRPAPTAPVGGGFFNQHPFMTGLLAGLFC